METKIVGWDSALMGKAIELRFEVFVIEQGVPLELEIDEYDEKAVHFVMLEGDEAVATLRLLPCGNDAKIGRVAVRQGARRRGLGTALLQSGLAHAVSLGFDAIVLDSQLSSMPFYERLGFAAEGDIFDDAGIPHRRMRLKLG